MMQGLICGPKLAACGIVLSSWAVIMLAVLGICFSTHSAVLFEDVPGVSSANNTFHDLNPPQKVYDLYNQVGYNCFIAAGIYVLVGAFSCCQMKLNKQKAYLVR